MHRKGTVFYNPTIVANQENFKEAQEQFDQVMREAPKPNDCPGKNIVVAPKFVFTGHTINIKDLLDDNDQAVEKVVVNKL